MFQKSLCTQQILGPEHLFEIPCKQISLPQPFLDAIKAMLPASTDSLKAIAQSQANYQLCSILIEFCELGWPPKEPTL